MVKEVNEINLAKKINVGADKLSKVVIQSAIARVIQVSTLGVIRRSY